MNPLTALAKSQLDKFEREWNYDVSYMRVILAAGIGALRAMLGLQRISEYRLRVRRAQPIVPSWAIAGGAAGRKQTVRRRLSSPSA